METVASILHKTPSLSTHLVKVQAYQEPQQLEPVPVSDEVLKLLPVTPDPKTQQEYIDNHKKAVDKHNNRNAFVKEIDRSALSEYGAAYRANQGKLNTHQPSQLETILAKLDAKLQVAKRQQVIDFDTAYIVVKEAFKKEVARKNKEVWFSDEQAEIVQDVIRYFIGDAASPYPMHKGLFIHGKYGVGKTILFDVMKILCEIVPIKDMAFAEISSVNYVKESVDFKSDKIKIDPFKKYQKGHLLLNDLGEEQQKIHNYKNVINPIGDLLSIRNISFDQYGYKTHATSNLGLGEKETDLEDSLLLLYGERILDRFYDQFTVIKMPGESKRG